jgi:predicted RNA-binding Zn-ribbon protein involved in translation (DUF1610 family)
MLIIDCPLCDGHATTDEALTALDCPDCGATVEVVARSDEPALLVAA